MIKKVIVFLVFVMVSVMVSGVVLELTLRALGNSPYRLPTFSFTSEPTWCFGKDSLGIVPIPGTFDVNLNGLLHTVTHGLDSNRITSYDSYLEDDQRPEIYLYGCSYPYGQGVDDQESYPFVLQQKFPAFRVRNYSRPGYGTLQAFLQLNKAFNSGFRPKLVIVNFASFHEERNVLSRSYQYKLHLGCELMNADAEKMIYPMATALKDSFHVSYENVIHKFKPVPFRKTSALMNMIDLKLSAIGTEQLKDMASSKMLLRFINALCKKHQTQLVIADIAYSNGSSIIKEYCQANKMDYVNISPDFLAGGFRNLPYDSHPNARAHKVYAQKMTEYLNGILPAQ
jgi:hypothetical protein